MKLLDRPLPVAASDGVHGLAVTEVPASLFCCLSPESRLVRASLLATGVKRGCLSTTMGLRLDIEEALTC